MLSQCRLVPIDVLVAACAICTAQPSNAQLTAPETEQLSAALYAASEVSVTDPALCLSKVISVKALVARTWTFHVLHWHGIASACEHPPSTSPASIGDIDRHAQQMLAHFDAAPPGVPTLAAAVMQVKAWRWGAMHAHGHTAQALAAERAEVDRLLAAMAESPPAADAAAELLQWAVSLYGGHGKNAALPALHQRVTDALGPGHVVSLRVLQARIFSERNMTRFARALAMCDEFVALLREHRPQDARMAMSQSSERLGALEGLGRFADALDEGLKVRDWSLKQVPLRHGNLMRTYYNLAGLALSVGDYEQAVTYARSSVQHGELSDVFGDKQEANVGRILLLDSRLRRGDAAAVPLLQDALLTLGDGDIVTLAPAYTLARYAIGTGNSEQLRRAQQLLTRSIEGGLDPMHGGRALPALVGADAAVPGDSQGMAQATTAMARSLVGRDVDLSVAAPFALARHATAEHPDAALWLYKRGANALQQLRAGLPSGDSALPSSGLAEHEPALRAFVGLLIDRGRLVEAQQALGVLREEELHEFKRRSRGARARLRSDASAAMAQSISYTPEEAERNARLAPLAARMGQVALESDQRAEQEMNCKRSANPPFQPILNAATLQSLR